MTDGPGNHRALADLVERCEPLVAHLVGYGLAGHPDQGGVVGGVMQRARRDVHQLRDPAGVRAWIAAQALWQVRHLRQPGLGAPVEGLTGEAQRIAAAADRLTPPDRDALALWWLCVAGVLTEAEAGRVLGVDDPAQHGRDMLARLDVARTVLAALAAANACQGLLTLAASSGRSEFQSRHVAECPTCARHGEALEPAAAVLAAAGPVRLPGGAWSAASTALLPLPRRPPALMSSPTATLPVPVRSLPATTVPEAPARRRMATKRRAWQFGLVALAVLAAGLVVVNLPGKSLPRVGPSPTGTAQALAPTGSATVAAADPGLPATVLPVAPPTGPATAQAGGSASSPAPGSGPAGQPATTRPPATTRATTPVAQPATLFSDDFESGSAAGWSQSGGAWGVVSDGGSLVLRQTNPTPGLSRVFDGDIGWADYSLRARVKPLSFGYSGLVGVTARTAGVATYYRLALAGDGRAVLQAYAGSTSITTLASAPVGVAAGTWYALRIDVSGSNVTGYVNGQRIGSGTSTLAGTGRIGLQTYFATAEFDNVIVTAAG